MSDTSAGSTFFPEDICASALGELRAWTSVQAVLAAARMIEGRPLEEDQPATTIILPFEDQLNFDHIFSALIGWLIKSYYVPPAKIALARSVDPLICDKTVALLEALRFRPTIKLSAVGAITGLLPNQRAIIVEDQVETIEVMQAPLRCFMQVLFNGYSTASSMRGIRVESKEQTGGAPTIFHRPYSDSRFSAVVEALCFYLLGLEIGPMWSDNGKQNVDVAYRSVNVQGPLPIDERMFDIAFTSMKGMLDGLR